jgi:hypothetical protein
VIGTTGSTTATTTAVSTAPGDGIATIDSIVTDAIDESNEIVTRGIDGTRTAIGTGIMSGPIAIETGIGIGIGIEVVREERASAPVATRQQTKNGVGHSFLIQPPC